MANINLLPWRAKERERRNREFVLQMVIVGLLSMLLSFLAWAFFKSQLESQHEANNIVKQANADLDKDLAEIAELEKTRENIVSRMEVIQKLQGTRPIPVHLFDSLVRSMPAEMFLTKITRKGNKLTLIGRANNPNSVSDLLRKLDLTRWFEDSAVKKITNSGQAAKPAALAKNGTTVINTVIAPEADYIQFELTTRIADVNLAEASQNNEQPVNAKSGSDNTNEPVAKANNSTKTTTGA